MKKLALIVFLIALVACDKQASNGDAVSMDGQRFTPETWTISAGETVRWVNDTQEAHTVTAVEDSFPDGADYFSSGGASSEDEANDSLSDALLDPGESFEWTFDEPGTYRYYCIPHRSSGMQGTVVVE